MARRYLQTGPSASPAFGGVTSLAIVPANVNLPIEGYPAPTVGQVFSINGGGNAEFLPPPASGIVDDPTVRTSNFTAVAGTRYFINSASTVQVNMPIGPADGDIVAVCGVGASIGTTNIVGNGNNFQLAGTTGSAFLFGTRNLDLAFRFSTATGRWESIDTSVSSLLYSTVTNAVVGTDSSGYATRIQLPNGDSVLGRVESSAIQELRPYHQAHNLYANAGSFVITDFSVGVQVGWLFSTTGLRAHTVEWKGASDLIVQGLNAGYSSADFRHDKVIYNNTGLNGTGTYRNIIWKNEDTAAQPSLRIRHDAPAPSTDFADYVQGPGTAVLLRYVLTFDNRWVLTPIVPSGAINRGVQTTSVTPTIIHAYTTQTNDRVISYKVQVQARKTVGTTVGDSALFDITVLCERDSFGTVVVKDVVFINGPYKDAGAAGWDVTFTISGSDIQMNVVGDAVDTIQWRVTGNITEHG